MAQLQNFHKQGLKRLTVVLAETRDHAVIRNVKPNDQPEARVPATQTLDLAARTNPVGISVDQKTHHHRRRKTGRSNTSCAAFRLEGRQVHPLNRIQKKMNNIRVRNPIRHVQRKKKNLPPVRFTIEMCHILSPLNGSSATKSSRGQNHQRITRSSTKRCEKEAIPQQALWKGSKT